MDITSAMKFASAPAARPAACAPAEPRAAQDESAFQRVFSILGAFIFLGGCARLISIALHGIPKPQVIALLAIELLGVLPLARCFTECPE